MSTDTKEQNPELAKIIELQKQIGIEQSNYVSAKFLYEKTREQEKALLAERLPELYGPNATRESYGAFMAIPENHERHVEILCDVDTEVGLTESLNLYIESKKMLLDWGKEIAEQLNARYNRIENKTIVELFERIPFHPKIEENLIEWILKLNPAHFGIKLPRS